MTIRITDELLAAYIEGKVSAEERNAVRHYLALHPREMDLLLALMDDTELMDEEQDVQKDCPAWEDQSFSDIAFASAAFAPQTKARPKKSLSAQDPVSLRRKRMIAFLNDLDS